MTLSRSMLSGLALTTMLFFGQAANAAIIEYTVPLLGSEEVGGSGDLDGSGQAILTIDDVALTIDWNITVSDISTVTGLHIHQADAGANGSVVVNFDSQLSGTGLFDADLANLLADPTNFYVNVHTTEFSGGALRGQITAAAVPAPATLGLLGLGLTALGLWRRRA